MDRRSLSRLWRRRRRRRRRRRSRCHARPLQIANETKYHSSACFFAHCLSQKEQSIHLRTSNSLPPTLSFPFLSLPPSALSPSLCLVAATGATSPAAAGAGSASSADTPRGRADPLRLRLPLPLRLRLTLRLSLLLSLRLRRATSQLLPEPPRQCRYLRQRPCRGWGQGSRRV